MYLNEVGTTVVPIGKSDLAKQKANELKDRGYLVLFTQSQDGLIHITWYLTSDTLIIN